jgi:uncharacterized protein YndB with AHSA1/START domain
MERSRESDMADMFMLYTIDADPKTVYDAITTRSGVASWWTTRVDVPETIGGVVKASFPDMPMTWEMEITALDEPSRVVWKAIGGPPHWTGTTIGFDLTSGESGGTVLRFDHRDFAQVDDTFRIVTVAWAQILGHLKAYAETGTPDPYFNF